MPRSSFLQNCRSILFLCCSCFPFIGNAQEKFTDNLRISANYHYGFVVPEYSNFLYLVEHPVRSFRLSMTKKTTGTNDWEQLYNYPEYGLSMTYATLGNDEVNGRELALFPFFNLDIISRKRFNFYNQTGVGFSYVTRRFDLEDNYLNVAVGSHINVHFTLKFGINYKIQKNILANGGISFDHLSNSNSRDPNLGINYLTAYAGLGYLIGSESKMQVHELLPHQQKHHWEFIYSIGGKHPLGPDPKIFFTSSATVELKWELWRALHFGMGADLFYDTSTKTEILALYEPVLDYKKGYDFRSGIHLSQEFVYSRLSLILQEGIYLFLTDKVKQHVMYNRGIIRYQVSGKMFLQLAMKSHLNILDYPEFGLGLKW